MLDTEMEHKTESLQMPSGWVEIEVYDGHGDGYVDSVAEEVAITLFYNQIQHMVTMASPLNLEDLALGYSLTSGIIDRPEELLSLEIVPACNGFEVQMEIPPSHVARLKHSKRAEMAVSACGVCGEESLTELLRHIPPVTSAASFSRAQLAQGLQALTEHQPLRERTGCCHAVAALTESGEIWGCREDIGRHVALDKLLGMAARAQYQPVALLLSSRASFEMVQKAAMRNIPMIFAVSAATSMAIATAKHAGITLAGFCRPHKIVIYSHPERLRDIASS